MFTDADVRWEPGALDALAHELEAGGADLLTVWPTQQTVTWGERLVVPLMAFSVLGYLPALLVHHARQPAFAAANGQCLAFRRAAYERLGGHAAVRSDIVEDISARRAKRLGLRLRMADGAGLVRCRMYERWSEVRDGYAKNLLAGHGGSVAVRWRSAPCSTGFVFLAPWAWLVAGLALEDPGAWPAVPLALIAAGPRRARADRGARRASARARRAPDAALGVADDAHRRALGRLAPGRRRPGLEGPSLSPRRGGPRRVAAGAAARRSS